MSLKCKLVLGSFVERVGGRRGGFGVNGLRSAEILILLLELLLFSVRKLLTFSSSLLLGWMDIREMGRSRGGRLGEGVDGCLLGWLDVCSGEQASLLEATRALRG